MGKKSLLGKIGNFMGLSSTEEVIEEYSGEEMVSSYQAENVSEASSVVHEKSSSGKVMGFNEIKERKEIKRKEGSMESIGIEHSILEPKYFEDVTRIADEFKTGCKMVTINISKLTKEEARRTLDFISGLAYALDAKFTRVGKEVFQILPGHIKQINEIDHATRDDFYSSELN